MNIFSPPNRIFECPVSNLLSVLCVLIEIFPLAHARVKRGGWGVAGWGWVRDLSHFKFGTFIGRFQIGILHFQSNAEYVCS